MAQNIEIPPKNTWVKGCGPKPARIMFIAPCVLEEEAATEVDAGYGKKIAKKPRMLDCPHGVLLRKLALREGLDIDNCYVTSIVKFLPENKAHRMKPLKSMVNQVWPYLEEEIKKVKPEIIVCLGKYVWDQLSPHRVKEDDAWGVWEYCPQYNCKLYLLPHLTQVLHPDKHECFKLHLSAVAKMQASMFGAETEKLPMNIVLVSNMQELDKLVLRLQTEKATLLSVDCEWHGNQHVDGKLRSLQIAWNETDGAYIRFMDDQLNYVFDGSYKEAGAILSQWCDREEVKYMGHHVSIDLMWMHHWLGLKWFNKAVFDTEFALQTCDESAELGLDILALRYTDFGKYDWDLILWKKQHADLCKEGYGYIPDDIMIPYGVMDVLTPMRALPIIQKELDRQGLTTYYNEILNPFVTNVFIFFGLYGLPIDRERLKGMRELFQWSKRELEKDFQSIMAKEAEELLEQKCIELDEKAGKAVSKAVDALVRDGRVSEAEKALKTFVGPTRWAGVQPLWEHYLAAPCFNIRSQPQMQRWLFDVKKYTPVKSTANKAAGMPSVDWEKVLSYPPEKQATFTPAADKGTLEILASRHKDAAIDALLNLNATGNVCKAFLGEADVDDEGNVIKENGLMYWLASDDAIHLQHSTTETGRPRAWSPNVLNWPSYINNRIGKGITNIIKDRDEKHQLPPFMHSWREASSKNLPTVRSAVMARPGWCIVEADYQTAEMRGLGYISGDEELLSLLLDPDENFGIPKPEFVPPKVDPEDCVVRLKFPSYVEYPADKDKFIMTYAHDNEIVATFTEDQLQRNPDNSLKHKNQDLHWQICELSRRTARETMNKKKDRGAAKTVNFSSSYGGQARSIARKIEQDTGSHMDEEGAQALLDAVEQRQPIATKYFQNCERVPEEIGFIRAKSGRIRHCRTLEKGIKGLSFRTREGQITALGRECRNFEMQESVGASASRACVKMVNFYIENSVKYGLQGYPCVCLYDSVVVHCPEYERGIWEKALTLFMFKSTGWVYHEKLLRYPTDVEFNAGWGTKPDPDRAELLRSQDYKPTPEYLRPLEKWLDDMLVIYDKMPQLSVYPTQDSAKLK